MVTTLESSNFGSGGNSSSGKPRILKKLCPLRMGSSVFAIDIELDLTRGQLADDGEEAPGRQGGGAFFIDLRLEAAAYADIQIGRR